METNKKTPVATIDAYIAEYPQEIQEKLKEIKEIIRQAAPGATEKISWGMPTFKLKRNIAHFAANKQHLGFYPGVEAIIVYKERLVDYKTSKGAVQFPYNKPLPAELIRDMVLFNISGIHS